MPLEKRNFLCVSFDGGFVRFRHCRFICLFNAKYRSNRLKVEIELKENVNLSF